MPCFLPLISIEPTDAMPTDVAMPTEVAMPTDVAMETAGAPVPQVINLGASPTPGAGTQQGLGVSRDVKGFFSCSCSWDF